MQNVNWVIRQSEIDSGNIKSGPTAQFPVMSVDSPACRMPITGKDKIRTQE